MARYVVMEPADGIASETRLADARIVRDGFHFLAFIFPPLWLLWYGLPIEAILSFAVLFGISAAGELTGYVTTAGMLSLLVSLYFGLEASSLRLAALRRRGWREWEALHAEDMADAEIQAAFLMADRSGSPVEAAPVSRPALPWNRQQSQAVPALGLLGYSGRA